MKIILKIICCFLLFSGIFTLADELDLKLDQIKDIYNLEDNSCLNTQNHNPNLADLGGKLFRSLELSGDSDTGCAICHLEDNFLVDGLPVSVGVGGVGLGAQRMNASNGVIVPRNSFTLFGRGSIEFTSYFWDGKIELDRNGQIISPFGADIDQRFDSLLAVAAIMPFLARDEFLGVMDSIEQSANLSAINQFYYQERYEKASVFYSELIDNSDVQELVIIRQGLIDSGINPDSLVMADIGNAIASFIISNFSCVETPWNNYLQGDQIALTDSQKEGAIIFFGKGRCASCHSGNAFSDFKFHSIGSPQGGYGVSPLGQDLGRAEISTRYEDRYLFRTPPLILVSKTPPYGHSGQFETLDEIVLHHLNPILYFKDNNWTNDFELLNYGKILDSRDQILSFIDILNFEELNSLLEFLESL